MTLLPDAEVMFIAWAKANAALLALHSGRVGTKLNATLPALRVTRVGGVASEHYQDDPSLQVEAWGADQGAASLLARTVVEQLTAIRHTTANGRLYTYRVSGGPLWAPDDPNLSQNSRYILTLDLLITTPVGA